MGTRTKQTTALATYPEAHKRKTLMPQAISPIAKPEPARATLNAADEARQMEICNKLAEDLYRFTQNYRTADRKPLTEGEVIIGLGFLLGRYLKDATAVHRWLMQVGVAAIDAAKGAT